jgi:hypothetical protein
MNSENPMTLNKLIEVSRDWDAKFTEIRSNLDKLHFRPDGIVHDGEEIPMEQTDRTLLFDKIGAPGRYFEKHTPEFQAAALAEHAKRGDFGKRLALVLHEGKLVTIVRGELFGLPNGDVFRAAQEALGTESETLSVARISKDSERLDVDLVSLSKAITVRPGDIVQSGLHVAHERFGTRATLVEAFILRLICSNGMTSRECVRDGIARTRKLPLDFPNNRELQMNQIRRLTRQNWNGLQAQLEALRATSERPARVEQLLMRWLQRARISVKTTLPRLLAAWRQEGEDDTQYGAVNALTRVATHDQELSERQRRMLASLAGLLSFSDVHICEKCFSVLARGAAEDSRSL